MAKLISTTLFPIILRFLTGKKEDVPYYTLEVLRCEKNGDVVSESHEVYRTDEERAQHLFILTVNAVEQDIVGKCEKSKVGDNVVLLKYKDGFYRISYNELKRVNAENKLKELTKLIR